MTKHVPITDILKSDKSGLTRDAGRLGPAPGEDEGYDPLTAASMHRPGMELRELEFHITRASGLARFVASYAYMLTCSGGADVCEGDPRDRNASQVVMDLLAEEVTAIEHLFHRDGYVPRRGPGAAAVPGQPASPAK